MLTQEDKDRIKKMIFRMNVRPESDTTSVAYERYSRHEQTELYRQNLLGRSNYE